MAPFCVVLFLNTAPVELKFTWQALIAALFIRVLPAQKSDTLLTIDCDLVVILRVEFDPDQAFQPFRKWYNYFDQDFKERNKEWIKKAEAEEPNGCLS